VKPQLLFPAKLGQRIQRIHSPSIGRAGVTHHANGVVSVGCSLNSSLSDGELERLLT
jgi:hypothetical protein